jgi:hypothetical protein
MNEKIDLRDLALRALIVVAGVLAALLLALKGQAQALMPLAMGAMLGALAMAGIGQTEE